MWNFREEKGIPIDGGSSSSADQTSSGTTVAAETAASTARPNTINPLTNQAFSQKYHTLYRKRITLPVFEYRADFMRLLSQNQCIVLVGEVSSRIYFFCCFEKKNG